MKMINTILAGVCLLSLTACYKQSDILGGEEYLKDNKNGLVSDCRGEFLSTKFKPSEADAFWRENDLPKGTANFVCKNGRAYLSSKVTDCKGNLIAKQSGGIAQFKINNNFPKYENGEIVGYTIFNCQGSKVVAVDYTNK